MCTSNPLAIDLFCGLGGWTEGLLAEGWDVIGFDIKAARLGRSPLSRAAGPAGCEDASRLAVPECGADRGITAMPGVQLQGDAVEARESVATP